MPLFARDAYGQRPIKIMQVRDSGGILRTCRTGKVRDSLGIMQTFFGGSLSVTAAPVIVMTTVNSSLGPNITTPSITVTPAGGTGPYTFAWNPVGVPPDVWIINTPGSATTSFTAQGIYGGPAYSAVAQFSCSVTDALGVISTSPTVSATARNSYAGPRNLPGGGVLP